MAFAIMVSLLVSVTLTPMLGARMLGRTAGGGHARHQRFYRWIDAAVYAEPALVARPPRRRSSAISLLVFATTVPAGEAGRPVVPADRGPGGVRPHRRRAGGHVAGRHGEAGAQEFGKRLEGVPGVATVMPTIFERVNHSHLVVQLKPIERAVTDAGRGRDGWRARPWRHTRAYRPTVVFKQAIGGGESANWPILVNLYGADLRQLSGYAVQLNEQLQTLPQFIDVKARVNLGNPELRVAVDRQRAADLGVRVRDLASALRLMVSGEDEITSFREDGERYPVKMRVREDQRNDVEAVGGLTVPSRTGSLVRIDNVARLERGEGPTSITRLDREFSVGVSADLRPGQALDAAIPVVRAEIRKLKLPAGLPRPVRRPVADTRRNRRQHDPGDRARQHLRLHGAGRAVRELRAAADHHDGAAACRCRSRC